MVDKSNNIILTGPPRSGTTLLCYLLNQVPNSVALHEPMNPLLYSGFSGSALNFEIKKFFDYQRQEITLYQKATSKSKNGSVPDNPMAGDLNPDTGRRVRVVNGNEIVINKPLSNNFLLSIKHPSFFSTILKYLVKDFPCFVIIRNPLSVLLSWNTLDIAISRGRSIAAEKFSTDLLNLLNTTEDLYDRQIELLNFFYQQYLLYLPRKNIIFYEDLIHDPEKCLSKIVDVSVDLTFRLESKNNNSLYNNSLKCVLKDKLYHHGKLSFWSFYNKDEILASL